MTEEQLRPDPLVPPEVDLRDFPFMPVDIVRLFNSEFHAHSEDDVWRAGFTLWLKSYHQVPASSIPNDDVSLARLAELGRDLKHWRRIREAALYGWVKCSDGRYYHPVVAEKALEGWLQKLGQRKASAAGNAKRYKQEFDPIPFDLEIERCRDLLIALNPQSRVGKKFPKASRSAPGDLPPGDRREPAGIIDGSPDDLPMGSQQTRTRTGTDKDPSRVKNLSGLGSVFTGHGSVDPHNGQAPAWDEHEPVGGLDAA